MTHRLSVYILYGHTNGAFILVTSYLHIHFSFSFNSTLLRCIRFTHACVFMIVFTIIKMINQKNMMFEVKPVSSLAGHDDRHF